MFSVMLFLLRACASPASGLLLFSPYSKLEDLNQKSSAGLHNSHCSAHQASGIQLWPSLRDPAVAQQIAKRAEQALYDAY